MQAKKLACFLIFVLAFIIQLPAQGNVADGNRFQELRAKAEKGQMEAQAELSKYYMSIGDYTEGVKWARKCAEQGNPWSQCILGLSYETGNGVPKDNTQAVYWYRKAAEMGVAKAQTSLAKMLWTGLGVAESKYEASIWYRKAAEQGDAEGQMHLGFLFLMGEGVPQDFVQAYAWSALAAAKGEAFARSVRDEVIRLLTPEQREEGQKMAREFKPRIALESAVPIPRADAPYSAPTSSGTGFFITEDGYLVTNQHVIGDANRVRLVTSTGIISAQLVKVDAPSDLALIKAEGQFSALPVVSSRMVKLGSTVATVGFPNVGLQGSAPKLAKGEIASLAGAQDDPRYFQISVPVQPGNSGGALVDELGNVVGVVAAKLSASAALETSGELPENVNYAVKSSFLLGFLESVPEVFAKLKSSNTITRKFEDVVKSAEKAAVLVLVYK